MPAEDVASAREAIVKILREHPGHKMSGALLGNRFRDRMSGRAFKDFGVESLSDFVKTHLAEVVVPHGRGPETSFALNTPIDSQGPLNEVEQSTVNTIAAVISAETSPISTLSGDLLRLWKSPNASYKLAVDKRNGEARAIGPSTQPNEHEVALSPPSVDAHRDIAKKYLESRIAPEHRGEFESKLAEHLWWLAWDDLFRNLPRNHRIEWLTFRENALLDLLDDELARLDVPEDARATTRRMVQESRFARKTIQDRASGSTPSAPRRIEESHTLRQVIKAAVEHMSEDDLRKIWLPIGPIFDALRKGQ